MNPFKIYIHSFKEKGILLALVLNTLFIIVAATLIQLIRLVSKPWIDGLNNVNLENIALQSQPQLQSTITTLRGFVLFIGITAIISIIVLVVSWSVSQGIIYSQLLKRKLKLKKLLLLTLIWFIPWLIIFFIMLFGVKSSYLMVSFYTLMFIFLHFSFILYILFTKNNKLKEIKHALKLGITRIHYFILPYILISITYLIVNQLNRLNITLYGIIPIYILLFSWIQNYTKDIIIKLED